MTKALRFFFTGVLPFFFALCTWISEAFQIDNGNSVSANTLASPRRSSAQNSNSYGLYRSISGLWTASTDRLSSLGKSMQLNMVATMPQPQNTGFGWSIPRWMSINTFFPNSKSSGTQSLDEIQSSYKTIDSAGIVDYAEPISSDYSMENLKSTVRGIYVAGYMDYDPKLAARNHYKNSVKNSTSKRDYGWFI